MKIEDLTHHKKEETPKQAGLENDVMLWVEPSSSSRALSSTCLGSVQDALNK